MACELKVTNVKVAVPLLLGAIEFMVFHAMSHSLFHRRAKMPMFKKRIEG